MNIYYCTEDDLSKSVACRLIDDFCNGPVSKTELGQSYGGGYGNIKKKFSNYCHLANNFPVFIITDLDNNVCAPSLRSNWLNSAHISDPLPDNMLFCIAQTEIESWLLADTQGISRFLGVNQSAMTRDIEKTIINSKEYLVNLARRSNKADIRNDIAPSKKSPATTGLNYNFRLSSFARDVWNPIAAAENSVSLNRAINKLSAL